MDSVVGSLQCEWFHGISVVVDRLSKIQHFIPYHMAIDALGLAEFFLREVLRVHVLPLTIVSQRGSQFVSTI